jgi:hypothetical protein
MPYWLYCNRFGMGNMVRGSCLCGKVAFELDPAGVVAIVGCYCAPCRKVSGGQYGVYFQLRGGAFRWLSGQDQVAEYESSPGNLRGHCRACGCVAPIATAYGAIRVPGGALDEDPGIGPDIVLFERSKAGWCGLEHGAHRFEDAGPPDFWRGVFARLFAGGGARQ